MDLGKHPEALNRHTRIVTPCKMERRPSRPRHKHGRTKAFPNPAAWKDGVPKTLLAPRLAADFFPADRLGRGVVEEGGVDVWEIGELLALDLLIDEDLDGFREIEFVGGEDGEGIALSLGATGSADAVDVVLGVFRDAVVDGVGDSGDIELLDDMGCQEGVEAANLTTTMTKDKTKTTKSYDTIKLGIDAHAKWYYVSRQLDGATPQPVQKMTFGALLRFVAKQQELAGEVHTCYEAGAFGYYLHRKLEALGVEQPGGATAGLGRAGQGREDGSDRRAGAVRAAGPLCEGQPQGVTARELLSRPVLSPAAGGAGLEEANPRWWRHFQDHGRRPGRLQQGGDRALPEAGGGRAPHRSMSAKRP
jgi:hypothetical protein